MQIRTFLRIMFNKFQDNPLVNTVKAFVNFCCEMDTFDNKSLKYNKKMPLTLEDTKKEFFFQSIGGDRIDCK